MNRNEILELANKFYTNGGVTEREIAFARFMMAYEREACAKVCDDSHARFKDLWEKFDYPSDEGRKDAASQCAAAIRVRGQA